MRIMYIAPRFHTNQSDIIKGWVEHGDKVCFVSHYRGKTEDYSYLEPVIAGYSKLFMIFYYFYTKILFPKNPDAGNIKLKCGFPPFGKLNKIIKEFKPDAVILRERSVYSMCAYLCCRRHGVPAILYNQSPVWEDEIKKDLPHRLVNMFIPKCRMTPVWGEQNPKKVRDQNVFYLPFVMEPRFSYEEKEELILKRDAHNAAIEIFEVGKYEERKNHKMLLSVVQSINEKIPIHLSIAGECVNKFQKNYYSQLEAMIKEKKLENVVSLYTNLSKPEMEKKYREADLFVIPSTREPASISQLEAMAFSLPVICSNKNGTACYVENEINGYLFKDNSEKDLKQVIMKIISDRSRMRKMGKESYRLIMEKYQFEQYYTGIQKILMEEKK